MIAYLWIALGSAIGGTARFGLSSLLAAWGLTGFPWATLTINIGGSFVIALFNTLTEPGGRIFAPVRLRQFVMIGICGGYTTFSAFSYETASLIQHGGWLAAFAYALASVIFCLVGAWLGHILAARFNRLAA